MIFLASPYRDRAPTVRAWRYQQAVEFCATHLLADLQHRPIYSPIVHAHPIAELRPALHEKDIAFWMHLHRPLLEICDELWVLGLPGWRESEGVAAEIEAVKGFGRPVLLRLSGLLGGSWERIA